MDQDLEHSRPNPSQLVCINIYGEKGRMVIVDMKTKIQY